MQLRSARSPWMSQVRAQHTIRVRSDNRRDWCERTEIVSFLDRRMFQRIGHGHTNEGFVLREGRFGGGVADDRVLECPERLDVDWRVYGHGHGRKLGGTRGEGKIVRLVPITEPTARFASSRLETDGGGCFGKRREGRVHARDRRPRGLDRWLEIRFPRIFIFLAAAEHL